jgi:hypothetical protein
MFLIRCIITFLAVAVSDVFWVLCVNSTKEHKAFKAAMWALLLLLSTGISIVSYTENHWLLIPAALGAFAGTYVGVKVDKKL